MFYPRVCLALTKFAQDGSTLLHEYAEHGSAEDVLILLAAGADPRAKDSVRVCAGN